MTPIQKMWLTRNRVWGNMIGGNARSGYKELKKGISGPSRAAYYNFHDLESIYPFVRDFERFNKKKLKYEDRR